MCVSFKKNIRYIGKVIHFSHHLGTLLLRILDILKCVQTSVQLMLTVINLEKVLGYGLLL